MIFLCISIIAIKKELIFKYYFMYHIDIKFNKTLY